MGEGRWSCDICRNTETSMYVELRPGLSVNVCPECMKKTRSNFVWVCTNCGKSYVRSKETVISGLERSGLKKAALMCEGCQLIQGIEGCSECNPRGVLEYAACSSHERDEAGTCIKS